MDASRQGNQHTVSDLPACYLHSLSYSNNKYRQRFICFGTAKTVEPYPICLTLALSRGGCAFLCRVAKCQLIDAIIDVQVCNAHQQRSAFSLYPVHWEAFHFIQHLPRKTLHLEDLNSISLEVNRHRLLQLQEIKSHEKVEINLKNGIALSYFKQLSCFVLCFVLYYWWISLT